ncbi:MAG: bifunctional phosphopantothenoylcysteine decarboxylase/phosphopantothenate--cysteine ligase CoaBC [Candidatus Eisenbacteria bacterium]|nr:bifunctional phosphopantothenoylcysteine decarboxylase/phosphopantothenate--cysteine ligase CoaBC [Candidatus Eisenbacteria bacterium]
MSSRPRGPLSGRTVVLGVTGSIAAFKAPSVVTGLSALGANVVVAMTANATRFVQPLTFETLSGNEVITDMWPERRAGTTPAEDALEGDDHLTHIHLAEAADLVIVAPASANIIGKMAGGIADDFLSTELLAMTCPVIVAPAMNVNMLDSDAVEENVSILRSRGVHIVESESGRLASGASGRGRLAETSVIIELAKRLLLPPQDLAGRRVLVTAGPTEEPIDPVRHVGNASTGSMGFAVAERALRHGAEVVLVSGRTSLVPPEGVAFVPVRTTREMYEAVMERLDSIDLLVMAAAPSDYRPVDVSERKIKKGAESVTIEFEATEDILAEAGSRKRSGQGLVGFALETENEEEYGRAKLEEKNLDLIVVNNPLVEGAGFGTETNVATLIGRTGAIEKTGTMSKSDLAAVILRRAIDELGWGRDE